MHWMRWCGALTGGLSVYNIAIKSLSLSIGVVFQHLLAYYQAVFYPLANIINFVIHLAGLKISLPQDFVIIYLLLGISFARFDYYSHTLEGLAASPEYIRIPASSIVRDTDIDIHRKGRIARITSAFMAASPVIYIIAWPLVFIIFAAMAFEKGNVGYWAKRILRYVGTGMLMETLRAVAVFLLFILLNAASPSIF